MQAGCSCAELNLSTQGNDDRVGILAEHAPNCGCEQHTTSNYSSGVVQNDETIVRMVCVPIHVHKKNPSLLPTFFNHAFTKGMSAQRLGISAPEELSQWVNAFLSADEERAWLGYVQAPCEEIRAILSDDSVSRAFCVYDAALKETPGHVEVCASSRISADADRLEARSRLRKAFSDGKVLARNTLKAGQVVAAVDNKLLQRQLPSQWAQVNTPG